MGGITQAPCSFELEMALYQWKILNVTMCRPRRTKCQFHYLNNNSIKSEQLEIILPQLIGYMQEKDLFQKRELFSSHQELQDGAPCSLTTKN